MLPRYADTVSMACCNIIIGRHQIGYGSQTSLPATCHFSGSAPRTKAMVRARAEPKTFFANERTFLSWLQISVLVMMTGLGLLGGSTLVLKGQGADGAAVACMDSMVCRASRVSATALSWFCVARWACNEMQAAVTVH